MTEALGGTFNYRRVAGALDCSRENTDKKRTVQGPQKAAGARADYNCKSKQSYQRRPLPRTSLCPGRPAHFLKDTMCGPQRVFRQFNFYAPVILLSRLRISHVRPQCVFDFYCATRQLGRAAKSDGIRSQRTDGKGSTGV